MKNLFKVFLVFPLVLINIGGVSASDYNCNAKNEEDKKMRSHNLICENLNIDEKFTMSFEEYRTYKEDIKPNNQFSDMLGIGGFPEQRLRKSVFQLWETFEKESSKQIGNYRLNGQDINNTFTQSLRDL